MNRKFEEVVEMNEDGMLLNPSTHPACIREEMHQIAVYTIFREEDSDGILTISRRGKIVTIPLSAKIIDNLSNGRRDVMYILFSEIDMEVIAGVLKIIQHKGVTYTGWIDDEEMDMLFSIEKSVK